MKIYTTGTMSFIATVAALVAYEERMQAFHISNKAIFWCGQGIFIIIMALFTIVHWEDKMYIKKSRFITSLIIICLLYAIAWTDSKYSGILIFICGVTETYFVRKCAGLVKK